MRKAVKDKRAAIWPLKAGLGKQLSEVPMQMPAWWYDEFKHFGVDFADANEVRAYDAKQGSNVEHERELVKALGVTADATVLELGCGTGAFVVAAAQQCHKVIAVDISKAMLDFVRERARTLELNNIEYCHAGFLTYGNDSLSANFVVSKFALHHLPDFWKSVALTRIYKTLIKGGCLFLKDVVFSFEPQHHADPVNDWVTSLSASGSSFSKEQFEAHIRDEYSTYGFIMEGLLTRAGFVIEKREYLSPMYAQYTCIKA